MFTIRRHINGITLNPYEYIMDDNNEEILSYKTKEGALNYLEESKLEFEDETDLWEHYGIEIHKVDKAQLTQLREEVKINGT